MTTVGYTVSERYLRGRRAWGGVMVCKVDWVLSLVGWSGPPGTNAARIGNPGDGFLVGIRVGPRT